LRRPSRSPVLTAYAAPNNILIENNFLDEAADHSGGPTYYALNIRECTNASPGSFDLQLAPGSPALNHGDPGSYPTRDIDGQSRPLGSGPDAGADEAG
jgi:hypothetical protein